MALADIYEVRASGTVLLEPFNVVFHALRAGGGFSALDVLDAFGDSVLTPMITTMSNDVNVISLQAKALGNPLDFAEVSTAPLLGLRSGDTIGPFAAIAIRFTRKRTDMHHGQKRLPGVIEADQTDGVLAAGVIATAEAFADAVVANWENASSPGTPVANYVIVKRVLDAGKYRLPESDPELIYYVPTDYAVSNYVSTQVSRKFGR